MDTEVMNLHVCEELSYILELVFGLSEMHVNLLAIA